MAGKLFKSITNVGIGNEMMLLNQECASYNGEQSYTLNEG